LAVIQLLPLNPLLTGFSDFWIHVGQINSPYRLVCITSPTVLLLHHQTQLLSVIATTTDLFRFFNLCLPVERFSDCLLSIF